MDISVRLFASYLDVIPLKTALMVKTHIQSCILWPKSVYTQLIESVWYRVYVLARGIEVRLQWIIRRQFVEHEQAA